MTASKDLRNTRVLRPRSAEKHAIGLKTARKHHWLCGGGSLEISILRQSAGGSNRNKPSLRSGSNCQRLMTVRYSGSPGALTKVTASLRGGGRSPCSSQTCQSAPVVSNDYGSNHVRQQPASALASRRAPVGLDSNRAHPIAPKIVQVGTMPVRKRNRWLNASDQLWFLGVGRWRSGAGGEHDLDLREAPASSRCPGNWSARGSSPRQAGQRLPRR